MIRLKRGDTFKIAASILGDGVPIAEGIGSWTISSQIRTVNGTLVDNLITNLVSAIECTYTLEESTPGITKNWPVGRHEMDVEYIVNAQVISTETVIVSVEKDITR